jgi:Arc-like DNA binding domain
MSRQPSDDYVKPNPRIPRDLYDRLQMLAELHRRSLSDEIVVAVEEWLQKNEISKKSKS